MKIKPILSPTVYALLLLLYSCGHLKEPDFKGIENVKLEHIEAGGPTLHMDIYYYNPNKSRLSLKGAEGDAWLNGNILGHFIMDTLINISGYSDFIIPIKLQVDMSKLLQNSMAILLNPEVLVKIDGIAKIGKSGIYIRYPIRYEGKQNVKGLLK